MKPVIIINTKSYKQGMGERGIQLLKLLEQYTEHADFVLTPNVLELLMLAKRAKEKGLVKVWAQHADIGPYGAFTGKVSMEALEEAAVEGVMLGHSETEDTATIRMERMMRARTLGMKVLAVVRTLSEADQAKMAGAEYIAYEPKELIGGTISITKVHHKEARELAQRVGRGFLVGAGVATHKDLKQAMELGAEGVLVASHIVEAEDQKRALERLLGLIQ